jgi:hypothetical protein
MEVCLAEAIEDIRNENSDKVKSLLMRRYNLTNKMIG